MFSKKTELRETKLTETTQADRRIQKTLSALRDAFFELVLSKSYDEISVSDIIQKANVGRSTFYQHFKNKDEILAKSMHGPLSILADCIDRTDNGDELLGLMEHFWENRQFAPRIFTGTARKHVVTEHTELLGKRLEKQFKPLNFTPTLPLGFLAHQLAEAQLVVIIDWLIGKGHCTPEEMAIHVDRTTKALYQEFIKT